MPNDSRFEVNKPDVVDESVDGEVLIVHLGTGAYYSSRGAGDAAWQLLAAGSTVAETSAAMGASAGSLETFVAHLLAEGLIRERTKPVEHIAGIQPVTGEPVLEKYTDMQELLVLDPIHDVEEAGWPKAKPGLAGG